MAKDIGNAISSFVGALIGVVLMVYILNPMADALGSANYTGPAAGLLSIVQVLAIFGIALFAVRGFLGLEIGLGK